MKICLAFPGYIRHQPLSLQPTPLELTEYLHQNILINTSKKVNYCKDHKEVPWHHLLDKYLEIFWSILKITNIPTWLAHPAQVQLTLSHFPDQDDGIFFHKWKLDSQVFLICEQESWNCDLVGAFFLTHTNFLTILDFLLNKNEVIFARILKPNFL